MSEHTYTFGKKLGPDPQAGIFPKAILEVEAVPEEDIDYQHLFSPVENKISAGVCFLLISHNQSRF